MGKACFSLPYCSLRQDIALLLNSRKRSLRAMHGTH